MLSFIDLCNNLWNSIRVFIKQILNFKNGDDIKASFFNGL